MKPELRERILAYNRRVKEKGEKADDCEKLIAALLRLPQGQLKKIVADEDAAAVLKKYGYGG